MDMGLTRRLTYHRRLFLYLLGFSWTLVACFVVFQYKREQQFKAQQLDARLQLFNLQLLDAMSEGVDPGSFIEQGRLPFDDMRLSVIDHGGQVIFDNSLDSLPRSNHLARKEITDAMRHGTGYTLRRLSQTTEKNYFYSAMNGHDVVVRSAVPYTLSHRELLDADLGFLWFMLGVTFVFSVVGYFATRRLGLNMTRLTKFAEKAERGERIYDDEGFPHDELGEISNHIVRLYAKMQRTTADLKAEHQRTLHEEQEKIRIKKQLTNNINHELKTPVASMMVCIETLLAHPDLPEKKRMEFISRCHDNGERLRSLLDDVSTITRMDDGSRVIAKTPLNLAEVVRNVVSASSTPGFCVHCDLPEDMPMCGNASLLESVFRNLLDNSVAYSGGSNIEIGLIGTTAESYRIRFADDGSGIDDEHLAHIFERFYRIDKGRSRKSGGTGLGLSIVKNAVMLHGGTISVANRQTGGLEFVMTIRRS